MVDLRDLQENEYMVESKRKSEEKIVHTYWTGECKTAKDILRGRKMDQNQFDTYKENVKGIIGIIDEIVAICLEHETRLKVKKDIEKEVSIITMKKISLEGKSK